MTEKRQLQQPLTIDEQVQNLKDLNLIIKNEDYAKSFLNDVSYFRFIKAYSLGLKPKNGKYHTGVTFEQIVELYLFNANLRQQLFALIERIEINLRARIANYFSVKCGGMGYRDAKIFSNPDNHAIFIKNIEREVERNRVSPFIKNFRKTMRTKLFHFMPLLKS